MLVGVGLGLLGPVGLAISIGSDLHKNNERAELNDAVEEACGPPPAAVNSDSKQCAEENGAMVCK